MKHWLGWLILVGALVGGVGVAEAKPKVVLLHVGSAGFADMQTKLLATGLFDAVDQIDLQTTVPTATDLAPYNSALLWGATFTTPKDATTTGNNLAAWIDQGHGVVQAVMSSYLGYEIKGAYTAYYLQQPASGYSTSATGLGTIYETGSPLLSQVNTFTCGTLCYRQKLTLINGAIKVADYADTFPLVLRGRINGRSRVDINVYPPSSTVSTGGWNAATDGARLFANALIFVADGGNPVSAMPTSLKFLDTGTGSTSASQTVTFTNVGTAQASVVSLGFGGAHPSDFTVTSGPSLPLTLAAGAGFSADVAFTPTNGGARSGTLQLQVGGLSATSDVALTGTGIGPKVTVTPTPIKMGGLPFGQAVPSVSVSVSNAGGSQLHVNGVSITGTDAALFSLAGVPALPTTLGPTASFGFSVNFTPVAEGPATATLVVASDDPNTPALSVPLTGSSGAPHISPDVGTIIFGNQRVAIASTPQQVSLVNSGYSDLHVTGLMISGANTGDFVISTQPSLPATVTPGNSVKVAVTFTPAAVGARAGSLDITSDDPLAATKSVAMTGAGTTAMTAISPNMLAFGTTGVTMQLSQNLTFVNSGNGTVKITTAMLSGTDAAQFSTSPMAPFTVAGNSQLVMSVIYKPTMIGSHSATLNLLTDDTTLPSMAVPLTGSAVSPTFTMSPTTIAFGDVALGKMSAPKTVTVSNTGNQLLTIKTFALMGTDMTAYVVTNPIAANTTIAAGASVTFAVSFVPDRNASQPASVRLTTDDPKAATATLSLTGFGRQAELALSPMTLDFGAVAVGQKGGPLRVAITNNGDIALDIDAVTVTGPYKTDLVGKQSVAARSYINADVTFHPLQGGTANGIFSVTPTDKTLFPADCSLSGIGVSPMVSVFPLNIEFGPITAGETSKPQTVTIRNGGQMPVTIEKLLVTDPHFVVDDSMAKGMVVPAGGNATFTASFAPEMAGALSASAQVYLLNTTVPATAVKMTGTGIRTQQAGGCTVARREESGGGALALLLGVTLLGLGWRVRRRGR